MQTYKGIIQKGMQRGTTLGFPTINIPLADADLSGVYTARVRFDDKEHLAAVFANQERNILEAHLLDFSGELYGKEIEIVLEKKLRDGMTFIDEDALRATIAEDIQKTRAHFNIA